VLFRSAMTEHARDILVEAYGVHPPKVAIIPHGVPDIPYTDPELVKPRLGLEGRLVILNFGLLEPRKRIELVIDALARIADRVPDFCFVVLGATHPRQRRLHGESYRESLLERAARGGLSDHVLFVDRYVELGELTPWLQASDVFVTPYRDPQQMVSGTLAYAVAAGKVVISTPYPHAVELLSGGAGLLTPFGNARELAENLYAVLTSSSLREELRACAYDRSRSMIWPEVGRAYRELFREVVAGRA
jgi:glycosyltransferase involved in cell wall biosynthesis